MYNVKSGAISPIQQLYLYQLTLYDFTLHLTWLVFEVVYYPFQDFVCGYKEFFIVAVLLRYFFLVIVHYVEQCKSNPDEIAAFQNSTIVS